MIWSCARKNGIIRVFCNDKLQGIYSLLKEPYCKFCSSPGVKTESCYHSGLYGFNRIYAVGMYHKENDDLLSTHIRRFKEEKSFSHPLGIALGIVAKEVYPELSSSDAIVPVPLHAHKFSQRGFNQSLELSKVVRNRLNKPIIKALRQTRENDMRPLKRNERKIAVKGLYELVKNDLTSLQNRKILLIDDVVTSGFTVSECAHILRTAGAKEVNVLVAGRTSSQT
jgi:ComF family protein